MRLTYCSNKSARNWLLWAGQGLGTPIIIGFPVSFLTIRVEFFGGSHLEPFTFSTWQSVPIVRFPHCQTLTGHFSVQRHHSQILRFEFEYTASLCKTFWLLWLMTFDTLGHLLEKHVYLNTVIETRHLSAWWHDPRDLTVCTFLFPPALRRQIRGVKQDYRTTSRPLSVIKDTARFCQFIYCMWRRSEDKCLHRALLTLATLHKSSIVSTPHRPFPSGDATLAPHRFANSSNDSQIPEIRCFSNRDKLGEREFAQSSISHSRSQLFRGFYEYNAFMTRRLVVLHSHLIDPSPRIACCFCFLQLFMYAFLFLFLLPVLFFKTYSSFQMRLWQFSIAIVALFLVVSECRLRRHHRKRRFVSSHFDELYCGESANAQSQFEEERESNSSKTSNVHSTQFNWGLDNTICIKLQNVVHVLKYERLEQRYPIES